MDGRNAHCYPLDLNGWKKHPMAIGFNINRIDCHKDTTCICTSNSNEEYWYVGYHNEVPIDTNSALIQI